MRITLFVAFQEATIKLECLSDIICVGLTDFSMS